VTVLLGGGKLPAVGILRISLFSLAEAFLYVMRDKENSIKSFTLERTYTFALGIWDIDCCC
jgi:hypothetical protein